MTTISEVLNEMKQARNHPKVVKDWRSMIPAGSKWFPGCPGKPDCTQCEGRGYMRLEGLPVGHKYFGKVFLCDCVNRVAQMPSVPPKEFSESYNDAPEDPPFLDEPMEEMRQAAFDTGEPFRQHASRIA